MIEASEPRRQLLLAFGTFGAMALASCSRDQEDTPSAIATLANHDKIVGALGDLSSAVDALKEATAGFDDENWRAVVPDVQSATDSVSDALMALQALMAGDTSS